MATNPILTEIQSHLQSMSPGAQAAVKMANPALPDAPAPVTMPPSSSPLITMPQSTPHLVTGPKEGQEIMSNGDSVPRGTPLGERAELGRLLGQGSGVSQISQRIQGTSFGQNHPILGRILGGLAQTGATIGDIGLAVGGGGMGQLAEQMIPGTIGHHQLLVNQEGKQVNAANENAVRGAQTAATEAEAPLRQAEAQKANTEAEIAPQEGAARIAGQNAAAAHENAETRNLQNPAPKYEETPQGPMMIHPDGTAQHVTVNGQPIGAPVKLTYQTVDAADGPHVYGVDEKGNKVVDLGKHYEKPAQAPGVTMIVPGPDGQQRVERLTAGQTVAPGAQTAAGVNSLNTPTTTQRTAAGRAETVVAMAPEVLGRIDSMAGKMGPIEGRWNEFMQGKVGSDDPDFAALRSDLLMMSSAVALAHAQGRLPENLREEFDHAINAPKQTPANLKATINTMLPWLKQMQSQGKPGQPQSSGQSGAQHQAGDKVMLGGKQVTIKKIYPDGTFDY